MSYREAVSRGADYCRSLGYDCRLQEAHATHGGNRWKVKFAASAPGARGHVHLVYNAHSRELLDVDDKVRGKRHGRGYGRHHP